MRRNLSETVSEPGHSPVSLPLLPSGRSACSLLLQDEEEVDALPPPAKPSSVPAALQSSMPLATVMDVIAKPPGSAPPFEPYQPAPRLVPLPGKHTLRVRKPHRLDAAAFGDLLPSNLQVRIPAKTVRLVARAAPRTHLAHTPLQSTRKKHESCICAWSVAGELHAKQVTGCTPPRRW